MAADNVTTLQTAEDQMQQGYAHLATLYRDGLGALMASSQAVIGGLQAMNAENLAFLQSRIKEGLSTSRRLAECTSPEAAIEVQLEFARVALRSYADQCSRLGELGARAMSAGFAPLERPAEATAARAPDNMAA